MEFIMSDNFNQQPIIVNVHEKKQNGLGVAGFVLALLGLLLGWIPVAGWILWVLGLIFSFIGIFRAPRGLAIAGLVISCLSLIFLIFLVSALTALFAGFFAFM
jgi:hypothetical protein